MAASLNLFGVFRFVRFLRPGFFVHLVFVCEGGGGLAYPLFSKREMMGPMRPRWDMC